MELKPPETPECEKLSQRTAEWNAIYPFIEYLYENRMMIAEWRDAEKMYQEAKEKAKVKGKPFVNFAGKRYTRKKFREDHEYLLAQPVHLNLSQLDSLLYKYFDVDPAKLEQERRELLEHIRKLNAAK